MTETPSPSVQINSKAYSRILNQHPWIFRSDLGKIDAEQAGPVDVLSPKGKLIGQALYSPQSQIALRMMTWGREKINAALLKQRIRLAAESRKKNLANPQVCRLAFGESDGLPSFVLDRFDDVLVFQTVSAGMDFFKTTIGEILVDLFRPRSVIERNDQAVRQKEGLDSIRQVFWGEDPQESIVSIEGKKYHLDFLESQKTGFFLDQRFNAHAVSVFCSGKVLDAFCNMGQFALQASAHAQSVECVDSSEIAIRSAQKNAEINSCANLQFITANVFDFLKQQDQANINYDTIILDPPAFMKSRKDRINGLRGYKEINLRALKLLKAGGILATFSCSQNLSGEEFEKIIHEAARDTHRSLQVLNALGQPPDHPWLISAPETHYLKGFILRVL